MRSILFLSSCDMVYFANYRYVVAFLLLFRAKPIEGEIDGDDTSDENVTLITPACERLGEMAQRVQEQNDFMRSQLALYNENSKRLEEELSAQRQSLTEIKELLSTFQPPALTTIPPTSCAEAVQQVGGASGVYRLALPFADADLLSVYCLEDPAGNGSAWTIVQRRQDGSTNFERRWRDYKRGFGLPHREYFIGLERLYAMTNAEKHELWIELEDFEGERRHAYYAGFAVADEGSQYALNVLGAYSGDAGDALSAHHKIMFSTSDVDNDGDIDHNCAKHFKSAWWLIDCFYSNLNGQYERGAASKKGLGIIWSTWRGYDYSLKYAHMAIRPTIN